MTEWSFETQMEAFQAISDGWAKWMMANKVQEVVVEVEAVGTRAKASSRVLRPRGLMRRPAWADNELPTELAHQAVALRVAMARPGGGTWTWTKLSMNSQDYRLVSDFDYDRRPEMTPPVSAEDCAEELRLFPRDPKATPEWMRPGS